MEHPTTEPPRTRLLPRWRIWLAWTAGLTIFFLGVSAANLDDFPIVTSDEVWIMSAPHKLVTRGVFGSDLYAGFFDADRHSIIMPVHHLLVAASFAVAGAGIAQARWVSLLCGVLLLWTVGWLAFRWYGLLVALLTQILLLFWRSVLVPLSPGLPLLAVSRSARYDVGAVAWIWLSILLLHNLLCRPRRGTAIALGLCAALATLTQFYGLFVLPLIGIVLLRQRSRLPLAGLHTCWAVGGFLLVMLPYAAYVLLHHEALLAQVAFRHGERIAFHRPAFYLDALLREPQRYVHLLHRFTPGPWLLTIGIWPALICLWRRVKDRGNTPDFILLLSVLLFPGLLAVLDQTKAPLYSIVLLPSLCLAVALWGARVARWSWHQSGRLPRAARYAGAGLLTLVLLEGAAAYLIDVQRSQQISDYEKVGRTIAVHLEPHARVAGAERWWWALHDHPYLSMTGLFLRWHIAQTHEEAQLDFSTTLRRAEVDYLLIGEGVRADVERQPRLLQQQFWRFLSTSCTQVATVADRTYGDIDVYRVTKPPHAPMGEHP